MTFRQIDNDALAAALEDDDYSGFCTACGYQQDGCEPDAREYKCDHCGEHSVYGAEELVLMGANPF